jgi:hypothetical protein
MSRNIPISLYSAHKQSFIICLCNIRELQANCPPAVEASNGQRSQANGGHMLAASQGKLIHIFSSRTLDKAWRVGGVFVLCVARVVCLLLAHDSYCTLFYLLDLVGCFLVCAKYISSCFMFKSHGHNIVQAVASM